MPSSSLLKQVPTMKVLSMPLVPTMQRSDEHILFDLYQKKIRNCLDSFGMDNSIHLQSCLSTILIFLPYIIMWYEETWTG